MHQIRYFVALCGTLNFTRASEECHVTQPSLTRAIKSLEDELGAELFRRERSRTHLTEFGRRMLPLLRQSLDSALAAKAMAESYGRGETSSLSLGISETIDIKILMPALRELTRIMPGLELQLARKSANAVMHDLEVGEVELCVTAIGEDGWERIDRWPLFTEDFVLLAGARGPFRDKSVIDFGDLEGQKLISRPYCEHNVTLSEMIGDRRIEVEWGHEFSDEADFVTIVGSGLGMGIAPRTTPVPEGVVVISIERAALNRTVSLFAVSGRRYSSAVSGFIRLLRGADWSAQECGSKRSL